MKNLAFVIWMLGFPVFMNTSQAEAVDTIGAVAISIILIWLGVGIALYESTD